MWKEWLQSSFFQRPYHHPYHSSDHSPFPFDFISSLPLIHLDFLELIFTFLTTNKCQKREDGTNVKPPVHDGNRLISFYRDIPFIEAHPYPRILSIDPSFNPTIASPISRPPTPLLPHIQQNRLEITRQWLFFSHSHRTREVYIGFSVSVGLETNCP